MLLISESPYELVFGGEVAVLEQDTALGSLPQYLYKQDLKCVLVALFEYVLIIVHRSIKQPVINNKKQTGSS